MPKQSTGKEKTPPAGIYLHIPFCQAKCPYCDFLSTIDLKLLPDFLAGLVREVHLRATDTLRFDSLCFDSIYFGGGTPSLLAGGAVADLLALLREHFTILPDTEITLEGNPESLDLARLAAYREAGVNRLSIGVQSFQSHNLRFLGRGHTASQSRAAVRDARAAGFTNIGLDLICGLPGQTKGDWQRDLEAAVAAEPEHLSCYLLTFEPGTRFGIRRRRGTLKPLADEVQADLMMHTHRFLHAKGYAAYEISNFARRTPPGGPDLRSRHNRKYWMHTPYLGLGPAAHSFLPPVRSWNEKGLHRYLDRLAAGALPLADDERLTPQQERTEAVYLGLRQTRGLDTREFRQRFGVDFADLFQNQLDALMEGGLLEWAPPCYRLTDKGVPLADGVVAHLLKAIRGRC
ncbi:MAG: radical SAM family heme chaperone HemW [Desulfosarcinaceae bacterium]